MFTRFILFLLLAVSGAVSASAQIGSAGDTVITGAFTVGWTSDANGTNGTIRWNPNTTSLQVKADGVWTNMSTSASSGFPLSTNADAGGFTITNLGGVTSSGHVEAPNITAISNDLDKVQTDITGISNQYLRLDGTLPMTGDLDLGDNNITNVDTIGDGALTDAFLMKTSNGYTHAYTTRTKTNYVDWIISHVTNDIAYTYPGQLMHADGSPDSSTHGNVYICLQTIDHTNYSPFGVGGSIPVPGTDPSFWELFVEKGDTGATGSSGAAGDDGLDGVGNLQYGVYDGSKTYTNIISASETSLVVVSYSGRWYDLIHTQAVTGVTPDSDTNKWAVSIDKGVDATVIGTNLFLRGVYNGSATYTTNDMVSLNGNFFYVSPTNVAPSTGTSPTFSSNQVGQTDANWTIGASRGLRGIQGLQGDDGNIITNFLFQYYLLSTNMVATNTPSSTNRFLKWQSIDAGGTNHIKFVGASEMDVVTNGSIAAGSSDSATLSAGGQIDFTWDTNRVVDLINELAGSGDGTITGGTITASSSDSVTIVGGNMEITWNTNAASGAGGGGGGGGGSALFTNAYGQLGFTNSLGVFEPAGKHEVSLRHETPTTLRRYETDDGWSNRNVGTWVYRVTNGIAEIEGPSEAAQARWWDYQAVDSTKNSRARIQLLNWLSPSTTKNGYDWTGFACEDTGFTNHVFLIHQQNTDDAQYKARYFDYSGSGAEESEVADAYDIRDRVVEPHRFAPNWLFIDYSTNNGTIRFYTGADEHSPQLIEVITNQSPIQAYQMMIRPVSVTAGTTNPIVRWDNFSTEEGLWRPEWNE